MLLKSAIQRSNLQNGAITLSLLDQIHQTSYALKQRTHAGVAQKGNADYLIASSGWEVMCLIEMVNWIGSELTNFKSQTLEDLEDIKQLDARLEYMDAIRGTQLKSVAGRGQLNLSLLFDHLAKELNDYCLAVKLEHRQLNLSNKLSVVEANLKTEIKDLIHFIALFSNFGNGQWSFSVNFELSDIVAADKPLELADWMSSTLKFCLQDSFNRAGISDATLKIDNPISPSELDKYIKENFTADLYPTKASAGVRRLLYHPYADDSKPVDSAKFIDAFNMVAQLHERMIYPARLSTSLVAAVNVPAKGQCDWLYTHQLGSEILKLLSDALYHSIQENRRVLKNAKLLIQNAVRDHSNQPHSLEEQEQAVQLNNHALKLFTSINYRQSESLFHCSQLTRDLEIPISNQKLPEHLRPHALIESLQEASACIPRLRRQDLPHLFDCWDEGVFV